MKKQILLGLLAAGAAVAVLTGCDSGTPTQSGTTSAVVSQSASDTAQSTAIAAAEEYLKANFSEKFVVEYMDTKDIDGQSYTILNVMTDPENKEDQVTVEPTLAVRDADSALFAYYPDGNLVPVAEDDNWKAPEGRVQGGEEALAIAKAYCDKNFAGKFLLELAPAGNEPHEINGEQYWPITVLTNVEEENQVAVEPALAVKISDGSLWAYYPDNTMVEVEKDDTFKPGAADSTSELPSGGTETNSTQGSSTVSTSELPAQG